MKRSCFTVILATVFLLGTATAGCGFAPADGDCHGWVLPRRYGWGVAGDIVAMQRKKHVLQLLHTYYMVSAFLSHTLALTVI